MAIIGAKFAHFNGISLGAITNISLNVNYKELGRIKQYRRIADTATVSLISCGYDESESGNLFNVSGTLRWCVVSLQGGVRSLVVNELQNVTLEEPDRSAVTRQDSITFTTFNINGRCWNYAYRSVVATSESDAKSKCQNGWSEPNEQSGN